MILQAAPTIPPIDIQQIIGWAHAHQWVPLIALLVGFAVRLVKDDTKLPGALPAPWRPYFGVLVAIILTASASLTNLVPWQDVLNQSLQAILLAMLGHEAIIEGWRKGVEIPVPGLVKPQPIIPKMPPMPMIDVTEHADRIDPPEPPKAA